MVEEKIIITERSLGSLDTVTQDSYQYERFPPNIFNFICDHSDLKRHILSKFVIDTVGCPKEGCWNVSQCYVVEGKHVLDSKGVWLSETIMDRPIGHLPIISGHDWPGIDARVIRKEAGNNDPIVHIMKAGAANYGHMLVDMMPRLINLRKIMTGPVNLIMPNEAHWAKPILIEIGNLLDLTINFLDVGDNPIYVDELLLISPVSKHNNRKSKTLLELKDRLKARYATKLKRTGQKLLVWRHSHEKRNVVNSDEVVSFFKANGYQIIYPTDHSFEQQIQIFACASHVVGILGAGLTNIIFSPPECDVFMIDPGSYDFFFWDLACLNKQNFSWYFNQKIEFFKNDILEAPISIDVSSLDIALNKAGFC